MTGLVSVGGLFVLLMHLVLIDSKNISRDLVVLILKDIMLPP